MCEVTTHTEGRLVLTANAIDPSRTTGIRQAFIREVKRRFKGLTVLITKAIVTEDVFGLLDADGQFTPRQEITVQDFGPTPGFKRFNFSTDSRKVAAFMDWINKQVSGGILDVANFNQVGEAVNAAWTNKYIMDSYRRGVTRARVQLRNDAGLDIPTLDATGGIQASLVTPIHLDRLGLLFTRTFNELRGITSAMDQQISRVLAQGMAEGLHPRTLAKMINHAITGTGSTLGLPISYVRPDGTLVNYVMSAERRALIMARTETIRAHAQAQLQEFKNWGVAGVSVQAELRTAGDQRVCEQCSALEGNFYTIEEATNIIPVHAQCRCAWIPRLPEEVPSTSKWANETNAESLSK